MTLSGVLSGHAPRHAALVTLVLSGNCRHEEQMSKTKKIEISPALRKQIDQAIREVRGNAAVEAPLDHRYSSRKGGDGEASWQAYERYLLSDGHTVYVSLNTMKATKSAKPDKHAQAKVEKRRAREAKRAERKAAREAKKAAKESEAKKNESIQAKK